MQAGTTETIQRALVRFGQRPETSCYYVCSRAVRGHHESKFTSHDEQVTRCTQTCNGTGRSLSTTAVGARQCRHTTNLAGHSDKVRHLPCAGSSFASTGTCSCWTTRRRSCLLEGHRHTAEDERNAPPPLNTRSPEHRCAWLPGWDNKVARCPAK